MREVDAPIASANPLSSDNPPRPELAVPIITSALESRVSKGRSWDLQRAEQSLEIPQGAAVSLRFSVVTQFAETSDKQGAGLFIENDLPVDDPRFSRTSFARVSNKEGDIWGIGQLIGGLIQRVQTIAPGSISMDFEVTPPLNGLEGTITINGGGPSPYILRTPFVNTGRLVFAAYSEGQAVSHIPVLEAMLKTPQ